MGIIISNRLSFDLSRKSDEEKCLCQCQSQTRPDRVLAMHEEVLSLIF